VVKGIEQMAEAYWQIGDTKLYEGSRRLIGPQGTKSLRPQQYCVLLFLLNNKGQTTSKKALMELLWNRYETEDEHRLQTLISDLRHVLGKQNAIMNIHGEGYLWSGPAKRIKPAAEENPAAVHQTAVATPAEPQKVHWAQSGNEHPRIDITFCITGITLGEFISGQLMEEILKRKRED
jgi:DNA-binding winged helix-turn-helix (wHTH) protein